MAFQNPLPGDDEPTICVSRQMERGVPEPIAKQVCSLMSTVLASNGMERDEGMIVVPALFTREGVHNGALKPWSAIKEAADTLVGTPFFVNQEDEHVPGVAPPVDDITRHHGLILEVKVNEATRSLTGLIGLYSPERMTANGADEKRIEFQRNFIKAVNEGGRYAISVAYGAIISPTHGEFNGTFFDRVETKLMFNSLSLVPRGAENAAIMNEGFVTNNFDVLNKPGELAKEAAEETNRDATIEAINKADPHVAPKPMDEDFIKAASIQHLRSLSPEVNRLAEKHEASKSDLATAKESLAQANTQIDTARQFFANFLSPEDPAKALSQHKTLEDIVNASRTRFTEVKQAVEAANAKAQSDLRTREQKALKALANHFSDKEIQNFRVEGDLERSVNALETIAKKLKTRTSDVELGANLDEEAFDEDSDFEGSANFDADDDVPVLDSVTDRAFDSAMKLNERFSGYPGHVIRKDGDA